MRVSPLLSCRSTNPRKRVRPTYTLCKNTKCLKNTDTWWALGLLTNSKYNESNPNVWNPAQPDVQKLCSVQNDDNSNVIKCNNKLPKESVIGTPGANLTPTLKLMTWHSRCHITARKAEQTLEECPSLALLVSCTLNPGQRWLSYNVARLSPLRHSFAPSRSTMLRVTAMCPRRY